MEYEPRAISLKVAPPVADRIGPGLFWVGDIVQPDSELFNVLLPFPWRVTAITVDDDGAVIEGIELPS